MKELFLTSNHLNLLLPEIDEARGTVALDLSSNELTAAPSDIDQMTVLHWLGIDESPQIFPLLTSSHSRGLPDWIIRATIRR